MRISLPGGVATVLAYAGDQEIGRQLDRLGLGKSTTRQGQKIRRPIPTALYAILPPRCARRALTPKENACNQQVTSGSMRRTTSATTSDRKSTRLNSSHLVISYAVFCLN